MATLTHDTGDKSVPGLEETLLKEQAVTDDEAVRALPTRNARFARGRELGRGGMGRVVEATDLQFNRIVAVKEVHAATPGAKRRFATEAVVTGHLEHPGIPSVYERGFDDGGRPFYAMRRVQGRTLAALLAEADTRAPARDAAGRDARGSDDRLRARARCGAPGHQAGQHPRR